jgi:hypothetical protein
VLMCGISVSLLFAIVTGLTSRNARLSWQEDRTTSPLLPELEEPLVKEDRAASRPEKQERKCQ